MLQLVKTSSIIDIGGGTAWGVAAIQDDLDNMANALARYHGANRAKDMMAEAFAKVFAKWSEEGARPIAARFALEVMLNNAFDARHTGPEPAPGGAA